MLDTRVGFRTHVFDFCRELGLSIDIVHGRGMDRAVDPRRPLGGCAGRRATDLIGALPGSRQSQSAHHPRQTSGCQHSATQKLPEFFGFLRDLFALASL